MNELNNLINIRRDLYADARDCLLDGMVFCIGVDFAAENVLHDQPASFSIYYLSFSKN